MESNEGIKHDNEKLPWALLPFDALEEVVRALQHGGKEYGERNWEKGMNWSRLLSATFRHLAAFARGKITDPETGLHHLAQAICNLLFLLAYVKRGVGTDDVTPVSTTRQSTRFFPCSVSEFFTIADNTEPYVTSSSTKRL